MLESQSLSLQNVGKGEVWGGADVSSHYRVACFSRVIPGLNTLKVKEREEKEGGREEGNRGRRGGGMRKRKKASKDTNSDEK